MFNHLVSLTGYRSRRSINLPCLSVLVLLYLFILFQGRFLYDGDVVVVDFNGFDSIRSDSGFGIRIQIGLSYAFSRGMCRWWVWGKVR